MADLIDRERIGSRWAQARIVDKNLPDWAARIWAFRHWIDREDPTGERSMFDPWDPRWVADLVENP